MDNKKILKAELMEMNKAQGIEIARLKAEILQLKQQLDAKEEEQEFTMPEWASSLIRLGCRPDGVNLLIKTNPKEREHERYFRLQTTPRFGVPIKARLEGNGHKCWVGTENGKYEVKWLR